jgi:hypothetical protein
MVPSSAVCVPVDWPTSADELDGADATSDGCTTNAEIAIPRIARLTSKSCAYDGLVLTVVRCRPCLH